MRLTPLLLLLPLLVAATPLHGPCATGQLLEAHAHWDELSPIERHELMLNLPPYRASLAAGQPGWDEVDPASAERDTCMTIEDLRAGGWDIGPYDSSLSSEHFALEYSSQQLEPDVAQDTLDALEAAWQTQIDVEGFPAPAGDGFQMPVWVEFIDSGLGGLTWTWPCDGQDLPFIVLNPNWLQHADKRENLAHHEFFHTVQTGVWWAEISTLEAPNRWLAESTATYVNGWLAPESQEWNAANYVPYRTVEPWRTIDDAEGFEPYGAYLFWQALASEEGPGFLLDFVDSTSGRVGWAWDDALDETANLSTDATLASLARRLPTMDFGIDALQGWGPADVQYQGLGTDRIGGMAGQHGPGYLPLDVTLDQEGTAPQHTGTALVSIASRGLVDDEGLWIEVSGDTKTRWSFQFVATRDGETSSTFSPEVVAGQTSAFFGNFPQIDAVFITATPLDDFGGGIAPWSYTAELQPSGEFEGFADEAPDLGCASGCSASPRGLLLWPLLLARRRRRS